MFWREGKQTVTSEEVVAFAVEQIKDADRSVEYREVQTPGVAGLRTVTYEVDIQNGVEVARTEIASITTKEPVVQVEVIGTKPTIFRIPVEVRNRMARCFDYSYGKLGLCRLYGYARKRLEPQRGK